MNDPTGTSCTLHTPPGADGHTTPRHALLAAIVGDDPRVESSLDLVDQPHLPHRLRVQAERSHLLALPIRVVGFERLRARQAGEGDPRQSSDSCCTDIFLALSTQDGCAQKSSG